MVESGPEAKANISNQEDVLGLFDSVAKASGLLREGRNKLDDTDVQDITDAIEEVKSRGITDLSKQDLVYEAATRTIYLTACSYSEQIKGATD